VVMLSSDGRLGRCLEKLCVNSAFRIRNAMNARVGLFVQAHPVELSMLSPHGLPLQAQESEGQASRLFWQRSYCCDFAQTDEKKEAYLRL
jgi:hypothetical protein